MLYEHCLCDCNGKQYNIMGTIYNIDHTFRPRQGEMLEFHWLLTGI